jgi:hypothetical protein
MTITSQTSLSRRTFIRQAALTAAAIAAAPSFLRSDDARAATVRAEPKKLVSYLKTVNGKTFVVVNERPYLMYGVQVRLDWLMPDFTAATWALAASCFDHAKALGFNTINVPVHWATMEPKEGVYDFSTYLDKVIDNANRAGLYVHVLWYGSDVCGFAVVPQYVADDKTRFPRLASNSNFYDLSSENLIGREKAAVAAMMAHIAAYDTTNRIIMIQCENEPDGAGERETTIKWGDPVDMAQKMYDGSQFVAANALINAIGETVHQGPLKIVTRINIGSTYRAKDCFEARPAIAPGVDIYGVDTYSSTPSVTKQDLNAIPVSSTANVAHQPEGGAAFGNLFNLVLSNLEEGGGFMLYELRTSAPDSNSGLYKYSTDLSNWIERDGTQTLWKGMTEIKTSTVAPFNKMIYKADQKLAVVRKGQAAAFNVDNKPGNWTENRTVGTTSVQYETWDGAPAFALQDDNGDLILMNLTDGNVFTVDPSYTSSAGASIGYFDQDNRWVEQYTHQFKGNTLLLWKTEVARLPKQTAKNGVASRSQIQKLEA